MLDFRSQKSTVRNYHSRGEQRKMLAVVLVIGLFVIVGVEAANPQNLALLWKLGGQGDIKPAAPLDNRIGVNAVRAREADAVMIAAADPEPLPAAPPKQVFPGVDPKWFSEIRDDTLFRPADDRALIHLFDLVAKTESAKLKKASVGEVEYVQLFKQPDAYRGQVVSFRGKVEGVIKHKAPANDEGISDYYQVWIEHDDHRGLLAAFCLELPPDFPIGERLNQPVEFTGIFFKRWAYVARDKSLLSTPLLVARSFTWTPPPKPEPAEDKASNMLLAALIALGVAGTLVFLLYRRRSAETNPFAHSRRKKQEAMGFERLKDLEVSPEVNEALRRMSSDRPGPRPDSET